MRSSPDDHLRTIDALCAERDWDGLLRFRDQTRAEVGRRSMTSIAALCEYRLALLAPARLAASVVNDNTGFASVGPLAEVLAQQHPWAEVAPHLEPGRVASSVAHERVIRGDDLRSTADIDRSVLDMPMVLQAWESSYANAIYQPEQAEFPQPDPPIFSPVSRLPRPGEAIGDPHVVDAFKDLVRPWTTQSNGKINVVTAEGDHLNAVASLGVSRARLAEVSFEQAMAWMVWAGASGGATGDRRGNAVGRFYAWHCVAALAGVSEEWPIDPIEMGEIGEGLHWYLWDVDDRGVGWQLRLAVYDDVEELGLAISATDQA
jgi:Family of unknown function (DUF6183)